MTSNAPENTSPARFAGLDGLRALAVTLVVLYHLFPPSLLPGGFIGVDVFFVISGFLITSLLLREHDGSGRIRLGEFWRRRARRLLPALAIVVTVCSTAAWIIGGDVLVDLGRQVVGAFTFSYNWLSIADGAGYFSAGTPELFRNFWSLAVEEQFYLVWPLVLPLFLLVPRAWGRAAAALALAAASAVWMGIVASGTDLTRAYFGTDTHAFGILLGVALAFVLSPALRRLPAWLHRPGVRAAVPIAGAIAVVGIVAIAMLPPVDGALTFPGAILGASILAVVAITAGVLPGSWYGRAIDVRPLRWIGDRSYGIYLWHWPLLVLVVAAVQGTGTSAGVPTWIGLAVLAMTLVAAEVSYRFAETPVRRYGFRGSARRLGGRLRGAPRARVRALGVCAAGVVVVCGTMAGIAAAPETASGEAVVAAGQAAIDAAEKDAGASASTRGETSSVPDGEGVPTPAPVTGEEVTAVGDSVMLASAPALLERYPGIQIDAAVSRSSWAGPDILQSLAASGALRTYVVVALGTNGSVSLDALERMAQIAGPDRSLVLVNAFAPREWIPGVNAELKAFAESHRGVELADWSSAITPRTDLLAGDQIHPGSHGGELFADVVASTIDETAEERAEEAYELELRREKGDLLRVPPVPQ